VVVDGVALHVRDWWPATPHASACPVLLIHGFAGSTYSFRALAPALAQAGHRVLAVDLPGYGYSARQPFPGSAEASLWALLRHEGADAKRARWCLVGHSMGARVVAQMQVAAPAEVEAVAYLSGSPVRERRRSPRMFQHQPLRGMVLALAERRYLRGDGLRRALAEGFGRAPSAEEIEHYQRPLQQAGTLEAILDGYARDMGPDATPPAALRGTPTLIVWGREDRWLKPAVADALAAALPSAHLSWVEGAAHSPMETHPQAVTALLVAHLAASTPIIALHPAADVAPP
jgi:pimeloyl-ACP methyl ester carboxylesterase